MTWFKVDDKLAFHAKTLQAGNAAMGAWVRLGSWCSEHETDGIVTAQIANVIATIPELTRLVEVGFLDALPDGGFSMHDFLKYNPSRAQLAQDRDSWAKKKQRQRQESRRDKTESPQESPGGTPQGIPGRDGYGFGSESENRSDQPVRSDVIAVLNYWAEKLYPKRKPVLDDKRKKRIKSRLSDGFTVEELKLVVDGAMRDDWIMGRKDGTPPEGYRDVATVFRDVAQVERLMAMTKPGQAALSRRARNDDQPAPGGAPAKTDQNAPARLTAPAVPIETKVELRGPKTPAEIALLSNFVSSFGKFPERRNATEEQRLAEINDRRNAQLDQLAKMGGDK